MTLLAKNHNSLRGVHITWHSVPGEWQVKEAGSSVVLHRSETKAVAVVFGRAYGKAIKGELFIHNVDGTIAQRESYGNDPFPPHG